MMPLLGSGTPPISKPAASAVHSTGTGVPVHLVTVSPHSILGICAECGLRITSVAEACQAMGCLYHNNCFICCCCSKSIVDIKNY
ncbi:unnamed protein product [Protopolystoma xenopodis]|uniref:LIM zinc-binding domain-containing protein n=1 Tax=Protopolystoma xenopodis TaxID=117903 RepID=A0A448WZH9_9PLAT|nr:unnamed protein product [Protopolystoma xenopodis]